MTEPQPATHYWKTHPLTHYWKQHPSARYWKQHPATHDYKLRLAIHHRNGSLEPSQVWSSQFKSGQQGANGQSPHLFNAFQNPGGDEEGDAGSCSHRGQQGQVRSGQVRSGQFRPTRYKRTVSSPLQNPQGRDELGDASPGSDRGQQCQVRLGQVRSGQVRSGQVGKVQTDCPLASPMPSKNLTAME